MTEPAPSAPHVFTIPPGISFADALARGLLGDSGDDPLALSRATVLLPTRRACRTLHEAFLRLSDGQAMLLPRMLPLGDLDAEELAMGHEEALSAAGIDAELPPALSGLKRQLLLSQLVQKFGQAQRDTAAPTIDQAARLAEELGRLLDQVETEGLDFARLNELAPDRYAEHWQITLEFLKIVTDWWPQELEAHRAIGAAARRRMLMQAQANAWESEPPAAPVIAAGSTGSIPATADLLRVVSRLANGKVVLPGLDRTADADSWARILEDPTHPQHNMARLLAHLEVERDAVEDWPAGDSDWEVTSSSLRSGIINAALKPAESTPQWRELAAATDPGQVRLAFRDVTRIEAPGPGEEATAIALRLREALQIPDKTAALVTPDRALARRVSAELARWDLRIDDSAGMPLIDTAPGTFLRLTAQLLCDRLAPLPLLSALKHPIAAGGEEPGAFKSKVRALEVEVLRGVRPESGFQALKDQLDARTQREPHKTQKLGELRAWLDRLEAFAGPALDVLTAPSISLSEAVDAHMRFAEQLAATNAEPGAARLWAGEAGENAADFAAELGRTANDAPGLEGHRYAALLDNLMGGRVVRPRFGGHPRLAIWGPLEARLQRADLMILGGLNEGTWPAETDPGPWLSRPMRVDFGLPPVERRIGLMAHDFVQAFSAPEVVLTRATRVEGTPTVPSRWLLRLDALLDAYGLNDLKVGDEKWVRWAQELDRPPQVRSCAPPEPRPPLAARPQRLSVTRVETWMRDPYDLYAEQILRLRALDPLDQNPGAAEHGTLIHAVLEAFAKEVTERGLPDGIAARLKTIGAAKFDELQVRPGMRAFWWPRFERIASWLAIEERARRADGRKILAERNGEMTVEGSRASLTLTAKADRIEVLPNRSLAIIDYKTGTTPTPKQVALGFSPQLPLEAAIAAHGGFPDVPSGSTRELAYWRLTGGATPGEMRTIDKPTPDTLAEQALDGLRGLIDAFADDAVPYRARPRPNWAPRYTDYDHLARVQEWSAGPGGEDA